MSTFSLQVQQRWLGVTSGADGVCKQRRADPLRVRRLLPCCLCTNMWMTCAQQRRSCAQPVEILGISWPGCTRDGGFTWESASRTLCIRRKPGIVHMPRRKRS
jgi:hypothetical protein